MIEQLDLAYAAGIFDGEGTVTILRVQNERNPTHSLHAFVTNTDRPLLEWLRETYGGAIYAQRQQGQNRPCWQWKLTSRGAADFLALLLPYLRVKRAQAVVGIEFQTFKEAWRRDGRRMPAEIVEAREVFRLRLLKAREPEEIAS